MFLGCLVLSGIPELIADGYFGLNGDMVEMGRWFSFLQAPPVVYYYIQSQ